MSKGWHWLLAVALIAALAFSPAFGRAASAQRIPARPPEVQEGPPSEGAALGPSQEAEAAKGAGEAWLQKISLLSDELSAWRGATLGSPQAFYGLDGQINSYLFAIEGQGGVVGHVLVGSAAYGYPIFEAGANPPPQIPTAAEARAALASVGLAVTQAQVSSPARLLHLGVDQLYALYEINSEGIAINLASQKAFEAAELKMGMFIPEGYAESQKQLLGSVPATPAMQPTSSGGGASMLPMHHMCSKPQPPAPDGIGWCGPCSGASIGVYYRDIKAYSKLPDDATMYTELKAGMGGMGPVVGSAYGPGFLYMTDKSGYYNFTFYDDLSLSADDYWSVVSDIDSGWPSGLLNYINDWHWRAIRGYSYDSLSGRYQVVVTDSATGEDAAFYEWSYYTGSINDAKVSIHN